jgi:hypothetical protein
MKWALVSKTPECEAFLRGPSSRWVSSQELNWKGFVIERHSVEPDERPESISEGYILGLWCNTGIGEHPNGRGGHVPYTKHPGTITLPLRVSFRLYVNVTASRLSCAHWSQRL